jgi:hypothetical protein
MVRSLRKLQQASFARFDPMLLLRLGARTSVFGSA